MFAAGLHVAIASPAAFVLEYSLAHNPMQHELATNMFPVVDGGIRAPAAPGLGLEIDPAFVERFTVPDGPG